MRYAEQSISSELYVKSHVISSAESILYLIGVSTFICITIMKKSGKFYQQTQDQTDVRSTTSSPGYDEEDNGNVIDTNTEREIEILHNDSDDYIFYQEQD